MNTPPSPARPLYLDDFVVGLRFKSSYSITVSEADIIAFARQFDPQPFHTDPIAANDSILRGLAASGWHTAAITMRLFVDSELQPAGGLLGAGVEALDWPRPVRPGDTLRAEWEVLSTRVSRTRPTQGIVVLQSSTYNQRDEAVQLFRPKLIVPQRPASVSA